MSLLEILAKVPLKTKSGIGEYSYYPLNLRFDPWRPLGVLLVPSNQSRQNRMRIDDQTKRTNLIYLARFKVTQTQVDQKNL